MQWVAFKKGRRCSINNFTLTLNQYTSYLKSKERTHVIKLFYENFNARIKLYELNR